MYYQPDQKQKTIPLPIALLVLLVLVSSISIMIKKPLRKSVKAESVVIERCFATNVTPTSASVFCRTRSGEVALLLYGENAKKLDQIATDLENPLIKKNNHYFNLRNLAPNKKVFFRLITKDKFIIGRLNEPFQFNTASNFKLTKFSNSYGKILMENGRPVDGAIVLITVADCQPISTTTKITGEWLASVYCLRNSNKTQPEAPQENTIVKIEIVDESGQTSSISTVFSKIGPIPTLVLGQNIDLRQEKNDVLSVSDEAASARKISAIDIVLPKENAPISGLRPIFKGTAIPNSKIEITIESKRAQSYNIYSDKDGIWTLVPYYKLEPGKHKLTVVTKDKNGKTLELVRNFTILKSGERVLGEATPSGQLSVTEAPSPVPSIQISPTPEPTQIVVTQVSLTATPPVTGGGMVPLVFVGTFLATFGAIFLFIF